MSLSKWSNAGIQDRPFACGLPNQHSARPSVPNSEVAISQKMPASRATATPRSIPNVQRGRGGCLQRRSRQRTAANPDVHRRRTQSRRCLVLSTFGNAIARICRLLDRQFGALWHPCWLPVDRSGRGSGIARRFMGRRLDVNAGRATGAASAVDECGSRGNSRSTRQSARLGEWLVNLRASSKGILVMSVVARIHCLSALRQRSTRASGAG
jgi:hypothetical protein